MLREGIEISSTRYPFGSPNDLGNMQDDTLSAKNLLLRLKHATGGATQRRSIMGSSDSLFSKKTLSVDTNPDTETGGAGHNQLHLSANKAHSVVLVGHKTSIFSRHHRIV